MPILPTPGLGTCGAGKKNSHVFPSKCPAQNQDSVWRFVSESWFQAEPLPCRILRNELSFLQSSPRVIHLPFDNEGEMTPLSSLAFSFYPVFGSPLPCHLRTQRSSAPCVIMAGIFFCYLPHQKSQSSATIIPS
jgi:hypothetical protein